MLHVFRGLLITASGLAGSANRRPGNKASRSAGHLLCQFALPSLLAFQVHGALAQEPPSWSMYTNPRFCYSLEVPANFQTTFRPDNSDGQRMESGDGRTELLIWGTFILDGDFSDEISQRIRWAEEDGWEVSYRRVAGKWASFSGEKDDRIFYTRAIQIPSGAAAFAQIEYPRSDQQAVEPIIEKLVDSLHPTGECRVN